jgi:hypothetical protein
VIGTKQWVATALEDGGTLTPASPDTNDQCRAIVTAETLQGEFSRLLGPKKR